MTFLQLLFYKKLSALRETSLMLGIGYPPQFIIEVGCAAARYPKDLMRKINAKLIVHLPEPGLSLARIPVCSFQPFTTAINKQP
tara:strand:- start:116 stop:367 length:252 start_codon:yes stop_codon:yes gene_type:complete